MSEQRKSGSGIPWLCCPHVESFDLSWTQSTRQRKQEASQLRGKGKSEEFQQQRRLVVLELQQGGAVDLNLGGSGAR